MKTIHDAAMHLQGEVSRIWLPDGETLMELETLGKISFWIVLSSPALIALVCWLIGGGELE